MTSTPQGARPFNVYLEPEEARWLDSMEGVPDWTEPEELAGEEFLRAGWQKRLHRGLDWAGTMAPGLGLAGLLAWAGAVAADWLGTSVLGYAKSPLSPILVTVLLGLVIRNIAGLPAAYEKGLRLSVKRILRIGVALLGFRLSLAAVGQQGLVALPVVVGCIVSALVLVSLFGRLLGLPLRLASLIAVGTSICGVSAVVATGPAIDADEEEVSYAVACVTLFGMAALFAYPFLAHWLFAADPRQVGLFLGTAIHDTSQVTGAGLTYEQNFNAPAALDWATTTKLVRNLSMGIVIPAMAIFYHRRSNPGAGSRGGRLKWQQYVPLFVIAFVVLAAVRSIGDLGDRAFGFVDPGTWQSFLQTAKQVSVGCLTVAMAAVGLGTSLPQLRILGWRPLCVGLSAAVLVGAVSTLLVKWLT